MNFFPISENNTATNALPPLKTLIWPAAPLAVAITLAVLLIFGGRALAAEQTTCPVMGGKINKELFADHDGKRVYFCCPACLPKFEKEPEKYIKILRDKDQEPEAITK